MLSHVTSSTNDQLYTIKINKDFLMRLLNRGDTLSWNTAYTPDNLGAGAKTIVPQIHPKASPRVYKIVFHWGFGIMFSGKVKFLTSLYFKSLKSFLDGRATLLSPFFFLNQSLSQPRANHIPRHGSPALPCRWDLLSFHRLYEAYDWKHTSEEKTEITPIGPWKRNF